MTPDQIAELKRIAEAATANLAEHVQIKWAVPRKAMKPGVPLCHAIPADMLGDAAAVIVLQAARIEALEGERDDMQSRYILRMADIREASGVGHKPMLDEVAGAIRSRVEALERALEAARSLPLMQAELSEIEDMPCHAKDARKLRKDIKAAEALVRAANLLGDRHD